MNGCGCPLHIMEMAGLVAVRPLRHPRRLISNGPGAVAGIGMVGEEYEGPALVVQSGEEPGQLDGIVARLGHYL